MYPGGGLLDGYKIGVLIVLQGRVLVGSPRNPSRRPTLFSLRVASLRIPGDLSLTSPRALRSRVVQTSEYFWSHLRVLLNFAKNVSSRVLSWLFRGCEVLSPEKISSLQKLSFVWVVMKIALHME
jgi:hypothetical protein